MSIIDVINGSLSQPYKPCGIQVWMETSKHAYHTVTYIVTYTRGRIDTSDSPYDEHLVARNM